MIHAPEAPAAGAGPSRPRPKRGVAPLAWLLGAAAVSLGLWALIARGLAALL
jgi:hypothetical protein